MLATGVAMMLMIAPSAVMAADQDVQIVGFQFEPATVEVEVGDSVTWTNGDEAPHTATADDGSFDTGTLEQGASGSVTFDTAGSFSYFCAIHPDMMGTVTVAEAGGGEPSPAPSDEPAPSLPPTDALGGAEGGSTAPAFLALFFGAAAIVVAFAAMRVRRGAQLD